MDLRIGCMQVMMPALDLVQGVVRGHASVHDPVHDPLTTLDEREREPVVVLAQAQLDLLVAAPGTAVAVLGRSARACRAAGWSGTVVGGTAAIQSRSRMRTEGSVYRSAACWAGFSGSGSSACTHTCSVPREIPKSAAIPRSVAPGVDRYRSTAWRRNSCV